MNRLALSAPWLRVLLALPLLAIGSCAPARGPRAGGEVFDASTSPETQARVAALWKARTSQGVPVDFCLGPGDLLDITVFHFPEMQGLKVRVPPTGVIRLPLIGELEAAGLTEHELGDAIATRLRQGIMKEPNVGVFVSEYGSQQVAVTGAVARPGLLPLTRDNRTLSDIISEAGGLTEQAGGRILFYPGTGSACPKGARATEHVRVAAVGATPRVQPIEIDVNEEYEPPTENPLLLPAVGGDAIVINRGRFLVDGWVRRAGAYDISPGMTVFSGITAAGGAMYPADLAKVVIWRSTREGRRSAIDINLKQVAAGSQKDVTLQAGDLIKVPLHPVKAVPYSGYWLVTNVFRIGAGLSLTAL
jgi:polysaccharide export outer membrane protein